MPSDAPNGREQLLIENAVLTLKEEMKDWFLEALKEMRVEINGCIKALPCDEHDKDIHRNAMNIRTIVIVLLASGAIGGGGFAVLKGIFGL